MADAGHVGFFEYEYRADRFTWRRGMCKMFGLDAAPRGGIEQWYSMIRQADRARVERELWTACALRRPTATIEYGLDSANGPARVVSSRVCLAYGPDGRPLRMSGMTVDVTCRQQEALRRARDEVFAALNHQLRTPLGALSSAAEVLQVLPPGSPDAEEARAVVSRQTARLAQLLDDLNARYADESSTAEPAADERPVSRPRSVLVVEVNADSLASLGELPAMNPDVPIVDIGLPRLNSHHD
jgi:signal transduction histidine kinase